MKRILTLALAIVLAIPLFGTGVSTAATEPIIRVLLSTGTPSSIQITLNGTYKVGNSSLSGGTLTATYSGGKIKLTHSSAGTLTTETNPSLVRVGSTATVTLPHSSGNRSYLGDLVFNPSGSGVQVINHVPLRAYLYGAVDGELSATERIEVIRAQVLMSKGFALVEAAANQSRIYDIGDTSSAQVYIGVSSATRIIEAVDALWEQTLYYNNTVLVKTHYGSANGGVVLTPKTRWGGTTAYEGAYSLRYDPFDLSANGTNLVLPIDGNNPTQMNATLYTYLLKLATAAISGTAKAIVKITGITGVDSAGTAVGLPTPSVTQSACKVSMQVSRTSGADVSCMVTANYADILSAGISASGSLRFAVQVDNGKWHIVYGASSGPRVGVSHKGAQKMADLGYSYAEILKFYYPGASIKDKNGNNVNVTTDLSTAAVVAKTFPDDSSLTPQWYGYCNATEVNFRAGPGTSYTSLLKMNKNDALELYSKTGDWYHAKHLSSGQLGYVYATYVTISATATATPKPTPTPTPTPTPEPAPTINPNITPACVGDVDGDGEVLAADASTVLRYLVGLEACNEKQCLAADMDGDGEITAADAVRILCFITGKPIE